MTLPAVSTYQPRAEVYRYVSGSLERLYFLDGTSGDPVADRAYQNALEAQRLLFDRFGHRGHDNTGSALKLVVHYEDTPGIALNNAYWDLHKAIMYLGDGDGTVLSPLGDGLDIVAHELAHGIINAEAGLAYHGQSGALHESFADILAVLVDDGDWQLGEDVYTPSIPGDALRTVNNPRYRTADSLPADSELHEMSGVPSYVAYTVSEKIGLDAMGDIWYKALTTHLHSGSQFSDAAGATWKAALELYGANSTHAQAVLDAWLAAGIPPIRVR